MLSQPACTPCKQTDAVFLRAVFLLDNRFQPLCTVACLTQRQHNRRTDQRCRNGLAGARAACRGANGRQHRAVVNAAQHIEQEHHSKVEHRVGHRAQSRGNSRRAILQRHVLQNALIPVITFLAVSAAEIMTGSIIIEQVFTIPGVGRLLLASISNRDFPVVQAIVVILAAWIVVVNFVADLLYQLVDPRIRLR